MAGWFVTVCMMLVLVGVCLQELVHAKEAAVAAEDYDEAKRLKAAIERLKVRCGRLADHPDSDRPRVQAAVLCLWHTRHHSKARGGLPLLGPLPDASLLAAGGAVACQHGECAGCDNSTFSSAAVWISATRQLGTSMEDVLSTCHCGKQKQLSETGSLCCADVAPLCSAVL